MSYTLIKGGNAVFENEIKKADLLIKDEIIKDISFSGELPENCEVIDADGAYISPGFVDIHVHGGAGYDFMDCNVNAFREISDIHLNNGTTTMLPTAVSAEFGNILNFIEVYKKAVPLCPNFCGIHLEGPYISKEQKGAHKEHLLHSPTDAESEMLLGAGRGIIKRITAAPELDNMEAFTKRMVENGVLMSVGHSNATSTQAKNAFEHGFSHITHLYSATSSIHKVNQKVEAGVIEAAYLNDDVSIELIADGKHVAVDALKLAMKIKGCGKIALVSDALRSAGTDVKESYLGEKIEANRVIIEDGVAKLPDRSCFAGSIATGITLLERGINHYGLSVCDAVKMLTRTPAEILGINNIGRIENGFTANIVVFDKNCKIKTVLLNGIAVTDKKKGKLA